MTDTMIRKLREERARIWTQMQDMLSAVERRDGLPTFSGEEEETYARAETDLDKLGKEIERREKAAQLAAALNAPQGERNGTFGPAAADPVDPEKRAHDAFMDYVKHGFGDLQRLSGFGSMRPENRNLLLGHRADLGDEERRAMEQALGTEQRDQGVATGSAGGFMVPQAFLEKLTEVQKYFGPMRNLANVIETASGADMPWPNNDDTANVGAILGENVAISALDIALTSKTLKAYMYTSLLVKVSWQLLNDSIFPVDGFLSRKLGQRLGRIQNTHFTTGTGSGQPEGILTNALTNSPKVTLATGNTTGFSTGAIGFGGLVDTLHSLNAAYRYGGNLKWQLSDATLGAIRKLSDSQGRPLWVPAGSFTGVSDRDADTLLGYPVLINSDFPAFAANNIVAAVGDWSQYYIIRDVVGVQMVRLDERYADQLQAGFFAFQRTDGRVDDVKAAAFLQASAT